MFRIQSDSETFLGHFEDLDNGDFESLRAAKAAIPELREVGFTCNLRIVDADGDVVFEEARTGFEDDDE